MGLSRSVKGSKRSRIPSISGNRHYGDGTRCLLPLQNQRPRGKSRVHKNTKNLTQTFVRKTFGLSHEGLSLLYILNGLLRFKYPRIYLVPSLAYYLHQIYRPETVFTISLNKEKSICLECTHPLFKNLRLFERPITSIILNSQLPPLTYDTTS